MEHTLGNLIKFSGINSKHEKYQKIRSFHYDLSGHVITTNSHILFASKRPYEIKRAGKTYSSTEYTKGHFNESELGYPNWKQVIPTESARKVTIKIPQWFEVFADPNKPIIMVLDYKNIDQAFIKIVDTVDETSLGFNAKYLSCFAGEEISILITSPTSPTIILSKESSIDPHSKSFKDDVLNEEWFYILMPIRLDEEKSSDEVFI